MAPTSPPPPADPLIGTVVDGRYGVEAILGEGGMGVVYRCRHQIIGKLVAMKVLRADLARDHEVTTRFLNEAKAASAIGNPHIIDISDFGRLPDGATYFIMEYLDGQALAAITEQGQPVPVKRILHIALQLVEGLAEAHQAGIVHRDLKPDNIFLISRGSQKDFVKILDFGIAKVSTAGQTSKLTRAGSVFGTPHYMSPEQAAGAPVDQRVDVYALGVILYELASGRVPFDADNFMGILTQHMYKAPVPIRALVPEPQDVPPGLEAIVLKCLSKRPEQRYGSMEEVRDDLLRLRDGLVPDAVSELMQRSQGFNVPADYMKSSTAMAAPMPAMPPHGGARWPLYAGLAGVGAAVAIVVGVFALSSQTTAATNDVEPTPSAPQGAPVAMASPAPTPSEPPRAEAPRSLTVAVGVEPADARIFRGGQDIGESPQLITFAAGTRVEVEIRRQGYTPQKVELDGSEDRVKVKLQPLRTVASRPRPSRSQAAANNTEAPPPPAKRAEPKPKAPQPSSGTPMSSGDLVDPWSKQ